jgi:hypothetical protein
MKHPLTIHPENGRRVVLHKHPTKIGWDACAPCVINCPIASPLRGRCGLTIGRDGYYTYAPSRKQPKPAPAPFFGVGNVNYCGTTYEVKQ